MSFTRVGPPTLLSSNKRVSRPWSRLEVHTRPDQGRLRFPVDRVGERTGGRYRPLGDGARRRRREVGDGGTDDDRTDTGAEI